MKYRNPVIPGFQPDPSICRVGEDYYLVNSSFEFFPGVPLFHSRDLVNWEQMGHVLTRQSQLPLAGCRTSGGIFAPTIRYHNGMFYMITTNVTNTGPRNFIVWTDDIRGEWSEPVWIDHRGIDPSLFWDEDGKVYYQGTGADKTGRQGIVQFQLEPETGKVLSEKKIIWYGTGGKCPEGPHMYKINGTYYLMIAEGGTEYGHMETIARADNVWGPFESCSHNPILSHRDVMKGFISRGPESGDLQGLGHADLVDDVEGRWWIVFHGIRPSASMLHHIGRETMLAPVTWENGWPLVNGGRPIAPEMEVPDTGAEILADGFARQMDFSLHTDFTGSEKLSPRWAWLREPVIENYGRDNGLLLTAGEDDLDGMGSPTYLGIRQAQMDMTAETVLDFRPDTEVAQAGLTIFHTAEHHYDLIVTLRPEGRVAILRRRAADMAVESAPVPLPGSTPVRLSVKADRMKYEFFAAVEGGEPVKVGEGRSQLLSTEVTFGTFTGCFVGLFCQGQPGAKARFLSVNINQ